MMRRLGVSALAAFALAVSVAACSGTGSSPTTAAVDTTTSQAAHSPVTLRIGTDDEPGRPAADQIQEFASKVKELSGGQIVITPVWNADGDGQADWDQKIARMVVKGDLDMAVVPARAWDTEGVTSLRALNAPFLITSNELITKVVTSDMADEMLSGLDQVGVTGLGLAPEGLREVFSFGEPLLTPEQFHGLSVRAPTSDTTYALLRTLGATVDDYPGEQTSMGVAAGTIKAAESSFEVADSLPALATVTGNLFLFPKVNSLVVNNTVFANLNSDQKESLSRAAAHVRDFAIEKMVDPADAALSYCTAGGTVVITTDENLAAFQKAAQSVYGDLQADPQTNSLIQGITALKTSTAVPVEPIVACGKP